MKLAVQLPLVAVSAVFPVMVMIINKTKEPASNRTMVKLDASIVSFPNAMRHNTELAENAINAKPVRRIILSKRLLINF